MLRCGATWDENGELEAACPQAVGRGGGTPPPSEVIF
jgi:hypothetical protein